MTKQNKLAQIKKLIDTAHVSLERARQLLSEITGGGNELADSETVSQRIQEVGSEQTEGKDKIIEGVFDGQNMVGPDNKQYSVPANYASKSKLVVGDTLKLTIKEDGTFLYKQIGPIDRSRLVGILTRDEMTDEYRVVVGDQSYRVLLASVTYFKGAPGDETVILVPKDKPSDWAAVENIIKEGSQQKTDTAQQAAAPAPEPTDQPGQEGVEEIEELS